MPISCPRCGRGAADSSRACLYCGAPIEAAPELPAGRRTNPHHVVWVPSPDAGSDVAGLEGLLRLPPYQATLLVRGGIPRIVRTLGDAGAAADLVERAAGLGLRAFPVDDHTLDTVPPVERVDRVSWREGRLELRGPSGELRVTPGTVHLVVTARVPVRRQTRSTRISMLSADGGATPGLPRLVRHTRTTSDHLGVLDLYPTGRRHCLRLREESTDYSGMPDRGHASALLHFTRLVELVGESAPEAGFDDRFARFDDEDPAQPGRSSVRSGVTILDGVERFGRYSRLLWMSRRRWPY